MIMQSKHGLAVYVWMIHFKKLWHIQAFLDSLLVFKSTEIYSSSICAIDRLLIWMYSHSMALKFK